MPLKSLKKDADGMLDLKKGARKTLGGRRCLGGIMPEAMFDSKHFKFCTTDVHNICQFGMSFDRMTCPFTAPHGTKELMWNRWENMFIKRFTGFSTYNLASPKHGLMKRLMLKLLENVDNRAPYVKYV